MTSHTPHNSSPSIFRPWQSYMGAAHAPPPTRSEAMGGRVKRPAPDNENSLPVKYLKSEGGDVGVVRMANPLMAHLRGLAPPPPPMPPPMPHCLATSGAMGMMAGISSMAGFVPPVTGMGTVPLLGSLAGLGGMGPLVPLLDMLVPAAEVERVCGRARARPKRFACSECGSAFSNKGQLRGHVRIHTGERPYACAHHGCHKRFTRNEELTRHRRIHSGARPFPCPLCDKRFGRKDHLKKHIRTHQRHPLLPPHPLLHRLHQLHHLP
nr:Krueppel-like factor 16 [Procambarus clarkii]